MGVADRYKERKMFEDFSETKNSGVDYRRKEKNAQSISKEISSRLSALEKNTGDFFNGYKSRYFDEDGNFINTYRGDSQDWFSTVQKQKDAYDKESAYIKSLIDEYKVFFDNDSISGINESLDNNSQNFSKILSSAKTDSDYFSKFKTEDEYNAEVNKYNFSQKYKDVDYSKIKSTIATLENEYNYFNHQGNEERKKAIGQEIEWLKNHSTSREVVDNMSVEDLNDMWNGNDEEISALQKEKQDINNKITFYNRGSRKDYKSYSEVEKAKERIKAIDSEIEKLSPQNKVFYYDEDGAAVTLQNLLSVKTTEQKLDNIENDSIAKPIYDSLQDSQNDIDVLDKAIEVAQMGYSSGGAMPSGYATATTYEHRQWFDYLAQKYGIDTNKMLPEFIEDLENLRNNKVNEYETLKNTFSSQGYDWDEIAYYNQWKEDKMMYQSRVEEAQKYGEEHPFMSTLVNIIAAPSQIGDLVGNVADGTRASNSDYDSMYQVGNPYDDQNVIGIRESSSATGELINNKILKSTDSEVLAWLGTTAYSGVTSVAQSISTAVACKALFGAAGEVISLGVLGSEAAASQYNTALMNGSTHGEALQSSIAAGAAEVLFEKLSLDHFFKMGKGIDASSLSALLKSVGINSKDLLVQGLFESSEELFTGISNRLTDDIINGDHSQYYTNINKLMAQGYSKEEATKLADKEYWKGLIGDAVGGFFGGFAGGSFNTGFSNISAVNQYNKNALNEGQRVLSQDGGVDALMTLAESITGVKTIDGKQVAKLKGKVTTDMSRKNKKNVGKLSMALDAIRNQQNEADITNALVSKGMSAKEAKKSAEVLMVAANQGYFSDSQVEMLEKSPAMIEVLREVIGDGVDGQTSGSVSIRNTQHQLGRMGVRVADDGTANEDDLNKYKEKAVAQLLDTDPNTSSYTAENLAESKFEVSDDGKTINLKTDKEVNISKIDSISESGEANLTLDDGMVVKASDISFGSDVEAAFIGTIADIKVGKKAISTSSANALYQAAMTAFKSNPNMTFDEAKSLVLGLTESYVHGVYNFGESRLTETNEDGTAKRFAGELTESQRKFAYELGTKDSIANTQVKQKVIDDLKAKADPNTKKKHIGKIVFEDGINVDDKSLTKTQKANLDGIKILSEMTNIKFHVFQSEKVGKTFKYTMPDGTVTSANGWFVAGTNEIWVDLNAGNVGEGTMIRTAAHEISHYIKEKSPKQWKAMADLLMKSFADNGVNTESMLNKQIAKIKKRYKANKKVMPSQPELLDMAYEEFVCDALSDMLTDGSIVNFIAEVKAKDKNLAQKILDAIKSLLKKWGLIIEDYKGRDLDTPEAQALSRFEDVFKKLQEMYREALMDADEVNVIVNADQDYRSDSNLFSLRNSVEETKDLIAVHNLSETKLSKSLELGGLPMPSIALVKAKEGHNDFGSISLVFNKETIDPQFIRSNKVYSSDAWTPTYPRVDYKVNDKAQAKVEDKINSLVSTEVLRDLGGLHIDSYNLENELNRHNGSVVDVFGNNTALKYAFLVDNGTQFELPTKNKPLGKYSNHKDEAIIRVAETVSKEKLSGILKEYTTEQVYEVEPEIRKAVNEYLQEKYKKLPEKAREKLISKDEMARSDIDEYAREALNYLKNGIEQEIDYSSAKTLINESIDTQKYESWVKDLFADIVQKEGIRNNKDLFTPSGNRRSFEALHYEHNLENVVKAMRESGEKGIGTFGRGNIFGAATTEYNSISEIKEAAQSRLKNMTQNEYEEIRKGFSERFFELAYSLPIHKDSFSATNDAANMLIEAVTKFKTKSGIANYLRSESKGWANYSDYVVDDLIQLVDEIHQMPTRYFEAKPQRAVEFNEVAIAIIPDNVSSELKQKLANNGIKFVEYENGNEQSRLETLNSLEDVMFSERDFSYNELVAKDDLQGVVIDKTQQPRIVNGIIDNAWVVKKVREKCKALTEKGRTAYYTNVPDIGTNVEITAKSLTHGFTRPTDRKNKQSTANAITNARVVLAIPQILKNSIEVNRSQRGNNRDVPYTHVLIGTAALEDSNGALEYYAVRSMVQERKNQEPVLVEADIFGKLTSVNAKKIDFPTTQVGGNTVALVDGKVYAYKIADLLNDVKNIFDNTFSKDVYQHFGMTQKVDDFSENLLFSDRDSEGNELSKGQQEYFKDSKVRDENGSLIVVYHGTRKADFTVFKRNVNFFTDSKEMADSYAPNSESYTGYLNITNPFIIDANGEKWSKVPIDESIKSMLIKYGAGVFKENGKWRTTPADIASAIQDGIDDGEFDYDGVIIKNVDDTGSYYKGKDNIIATDYITFNSNQFKNIDNKTPTTDPDFRYSERDPEAIKNYQKINKFLANENIKLIEDVKNLKELVKLQGKVTHGKMFSKTSLNAVAKRIMNYANARGDVSELSSLLNEVYDYIIKGEDVYWEGIREKAQDVIAWLQKHEYHKPQRSEEANELLKELRTMRISLDENQKKETAYYYGSYNEFRKKSMGRFLLVNDGITLDSKWQELSTLYPNLFDAEISTNDQPIALMNVIDNLQNSYVDEYDYQSEMVAQDLLAKIYDGYWDASTLYTVADAKQKEINILKFKHKRQMAEFRDAHQKYDSKLRQENRERITRLREQYKRAAEKKVDAIKQNYAESRKKAVERVRENRDKRDAVTKLQKLVLDTSKWISYPSKTDVKCPDFLRSPYAEFLQSIDLSSKRLLRSGEPTKNDLRLGSAMDELAKAIQRKLDSQNPNDDNAEILDTGYLDLPAHFVEKLQIMATNIKNLMVDDGEHIVNNMTSTEVMQLAGMIRTLNHAIKEMSTLYSNLRFSKVEELGDNSITFLDSMGESESTNAVKDFVSWDNALPYYAFKRFGEGGESVFEELMDAQDKLAFLADQIFKFKEKTWKDKEAKEWGNDTHTIQLPSGNSLTLTSADAMGIYCLSRRDNNHGLNHLTGGGVRVIGAKKGSKKAKDSHSTLTLDDVATIVSSLSDRQKEVAEAIQKFMSVTCAEWGNEISMKRFLTREFGEKHYYPIESNDENLAVKDPQAQQSDLYRLLNISATKPLTPNANNEVIIRNIFDVFTNHTSDMARLNAYGMALLDYMKWLNYREKIPGENGQFTTRGVRNSMKKTYGEKVSPYVINLIKDINGRHNDNGDNTFLMNMVRMAKTASVGNNLRVAFLQFTSYPRAKMVLSAGSLAKGLAKIPQISKAKRYCGIALWKSFGFYDTNIARSIEDQIKGTTNVRQKLIELSMKTPELADAITWGALWNACEYEVAKTSKNKIGSEEFNQEVGLKLREVVYATQVVDSILTRSQIMRSKSGLTQTATAYMSEPTLTFNILMDAGFQFHKEKRVSGSAKVAWKKTGKIVIGAVANYCVLQVLTSLAESLADAWRDDDDEEFFEKFKKAFGENLITNILPFNKIPIISDIVDLILSRFDIGFISSDNLATSWITQSADALDVWSEVLGEKFGGEDTSKTVYNAIYKTAKAISSMTGVSISGVMREVVAAWNNTAGAYDSTLKIKSYESNNTELGQELYEAIVSGNSRQAESLKAEFDDEKSMETALRKALRENDPRIKEAAEAKSNGNFGEYERLFEEIENEGNFEFDTIKSAINTEFNKLNDSNEDETSDDVADEDKAESIYKTSDINSAFENGDTSSALEIIDDIVKVKTENYINDGETENDAEKKAKSSVKSSMTSYWKPLYIEAYKSGDSNEMKRIRNILYSSGLYGKANEVVKTGQDWIKSSKK